jgi:alpha-glucosidase (family GH31 glycosyl hydrolase)
MYCTVLSQGYASRSIPIDVVVSDMAWHYHNESKVLSGGYAWSPELFPAPTDFLQKLDEKNLHTVLNLHLKPVHHTVDEQAAAGGTDPGGYSHFASQLGLPDPSTFGYAPIPSSQCPPPFNKGQVADWLKNTASVIGAENSHKSKLFAQAYMQLLDGMGTAFWWLDDEPRWVARILYEHSKTAMQHQGNNPPMSFARWGGLGSHR